MKKFAIIGMTLLLLAFILLFFMPKWHVKNKRYAINENTSARLEALGDTALKTLDVPIAALLIYKGEIIGEGYNTVKRDTNYGGHAEINAISDAIGKLGFDSFNKLDRNNMTLITTFEPCMMCKGAIIEAYIKNVIVVKSKPISHWITRYKMELIYQWNKQLTTTDTLQEALFKKHPYYHP